MRKCQNKELQQVSSGSKDNLQNQVMFGFYHLDICNNLEKKLRQILLRINLLKEKKKVNLKQRKGMIIFQRRSRLRKQK